MEGKVKFELVCSEEEIDWLRENFALQPRLLKALKVVFIKSKDELLDLVLQYFEPAEEDERLSATEICEFISKMESIETSPEKVGRALSQCGFASKTVRIGKEVKKVYFAKKLEL